MRGALVVFSVYCCVVAGFASNAFAQINWIGGVSSDAFDGDNWGGGVAPGPTNDVLFREETSTNAVVDLGASDVEWGLITFNGAPDGMTVNGTGTITANMNVDGRGMWALGGERLTTIHPNVVTDGRIQGNNGHDVVFEGTVSLVDLRVFDDTNFVFNGDFTYNGFTAGPNAFITGNFGGSTVSFNAGLDLAKFATSDTMAVRNGQTVIIGPDAVLTSNDPFGVDPLNGLGTVNLFNDSTWRLNGDNVIDQDTDLFSRQGGGLAENTFDLNGFSTVVELLGTESESVANLIIDFGSSAGANLLQWRATHQMGGTYEVVNFEPGVDTLNLGESPSSIWWTESDPQRGGDIEAAKAQITVNGLPYMAFDENETEPYWSIVDPTVSRAVELFNFSAPTLPGDYNNDLVVDAADYAVWRNNLGGDSSVLNGNGTGEATVVLADYDWWREHYGTSSSLVAESSTTGAPEPGASVLVAALFALSGLRRWRFLPVRA